MIISQSPVPPDAEGVALPTVTKITEDIWVGSWEASVMKEVCSFVRLFVSTPLNISFWWS
jgi:hypothetical protein